MNVDIIESLASLEKERGIKKEVLVEAIEVALASAYRRDYGHSENVRVVMDRTRGQISVLAAKKVVEKVTNKHLEISLEEAKAISPLYQVDDTVEVDVTPKSFGRIAAQTAKQIVLQRLREAERGMIFEEYQEKENEMLTGIVRRIEKKNVFLELGKIEGILPANEQIPGEKYTIGQRLRVYITAVHKNSKGTHVMASRTHPGLIRRLFELEVSEIQSGVVLIKNIAREAGFRSKIAVASNDPAVDPIGACVGQKGVRIERIVSDLGGEKIDIVKWSADPTEYIANALSPAKVLMVQINETEKIARVIVSDQQLSLAIGKEGQNARLVAKLTGWKIDIKTQEQEFEVE